MGGSTGADVAQHTATTAAAQTRPGGGNGPRWRNAARLSVVVILVTVMVVFRRDLVRSISVLTHLSLRWYALAVLAEIVSVTAVALSRRRLRAVGGAAPRRRRSMVALTLSGSAMATSLPFAGTGLAAFYEYKQFRRHHVAPATIGWTLAVSGIFSTTSLAVLLVIGAILGGVGFGAAAGLAGAAVYLVPGVVVLLALRYRRVRDGIGRLFLRVTGSVQRWRPSTRDRLAELPAQLDEFLDRIASLRLPPRGALTVF